MARPAPLDSPNKVIGALNQICLNAQTTVQQFGMNGDSMIEGWGSSEIQKAFFAQLTRLINARLKIDGVTGLSYYERNADFAFVYPEGENLGGSGGLQTVRGLGRRGSTQGLGTKRSLTVEAEATSVGVKLYRKGGDGYVMRVDGAVALTVTAAQAVKAGPITHWLKMPNATTEHFVEVEFTTNKLTIAEKGRVWFGPITSTNAPARGVLLIDMAKSQTKASEFTLEGPNASSPPGAWIESVEGAIAAWWMMWKTNDAVAYTAAQYETHVRNWINLVRPTGDAPIILQPPQKRKALSKPNKEEDELYIDALHRIAADTRMVLVDPVSDYIPMGSNLFRDGVHLTDAGHLAMAQVVDDTLAGKHLVGAPTTPAPNNPGTGTTPPADLTPPTVNLLTPEDGFVVPVGGTVDFTYQVIPASGKTVDPARQGIFPVGAGSLGTIKDLGNGVWGIQGVTHAQIKALANRNADTTGKGWNALSFHLGDPGTVYKRTETRSVFAAAPVVDPSTDPPIETDPPATGGDQPAYLRMATEASVLGLLAGYDDEGNPIGGRVIDVRADFGARGDGVTDDTGAVQRALTAGMALGGAPVYFPPGDYSVSTIGVDYSGSTWPAQAESGPPYGYPGPKVYGAGSQKTRIVQRAGSTGDVFRGVGKTGTAAGPANNNKVVGLILEGLSIVGTTGGGHGLYLRSLVNNSFRDLVIRGAKSGIYLARETFTQTDPRDDEYSYANSFRSISLKANREWGLACSGTASIGGSFYDVEAIGNGIGGFKVAPTNMTMVGCQAIGNGPGLFEGRGLLSIPNTNTASVNSGLNLIGFRSEGNGIAGSFEVELQSGIGYQVSDPNFFPTTGAHCLGVGLAGANVLVQGLLVLGGFWGISSANSGQKAVVIGTGSRDTTIDVPQLGFSSDNLPSDWVTDNGVRTSIRSNANVRFMHEGPLAFARTLPAAANLPALQGQVQLFARMDATGRQVLYAQFESGAAQQIAIEP